VFFVLAIRARFSFGRMVSRHYSVLVHSDVFEVFPLHEYSLHSRHRLGEEAVIEEECAVLLVRVAKQSWAEEHRATRRLRPALKLEVEFFVWKLTRRARPETPEIDMCVC
jgi:hypothetical protein